MATGSVYHGRLPFKVCHDANTYCAKIMAYRSHNLYETLGVWEPDAVGCLATTAVSNEMD